MNTIRRIILLVLLLTILTVCEPSSSSFVISSPSAIIESNESPVSNYVDLLAAIVSGITILAALAALGKKVFGESDSDKRLKTAETEISALKTLIDTNHREMKDLVTSIRSELSEKSSNQNFTQICKEHQTLEDTVNEGIDKLNDTVNELDIVETKLNEIKNHFDETNAERKAEIKEINETIKSLRENIREDINDVKSVIMKMLMNLRGND